jgi:hypothetical protein
MASLSFLFIVALKAYSAEGDGNKFVLKKKTTTATTFFDGFATRKWRPPSSMALLQGNGDLRLSFVVLL